jgi:hypothetical protein
MPPKAEKKIIFDVKDEEHFMELCSPENKKLTST